MSNIILREELATRIEEAGLQIAHHRKTAITLSSRTKIPDLDPVEFKLTGTALLRALWRDLGINGSIELSDEIRFLDYLNAYFRDFSLDEVKLAFEYWIAGELDGYVKKDLNHYGRWSIQFLASILKAFRVYRGKVITETTRLLPDPEQRDRTPEEKEEGKRSFMISIRDRLIKAIEGEEEWPNFWYSPFIHKSLCEVKLLEPKEVDKETVEHAFRIVLTNDQIDRHTKDKIRDEFKEGTIGSVLARAAVNLTIKREIHQLLLMSDVETIEDAFKNYEPKPKQ